LTSSKSAFHNSAEVAGGDAALALSWHRRDLDFGRFLFDGESILFDGELISALPYTTAYLTCPHQLLTEIVAALVNGARAPYPLGRQMLDAETVRARAEAI